ncbi:hypothetical protein TP70_04510 [Staphylococcus microti]|uniref:Uncharacterized protein n=1 Tax=Staphylococcus microti TaxID=569857 RepID=A0A0D6XT13_9STAP|nr:hypothetical protein [Staphylococcus microti]KIX90988.1 hypothetical protein TP70_04510 [Staphylococcus microti]PNZ81906.1 hypothetical protein CD132_05800 [Staphylococcus microti]SUM57217.1 Uncharacterised protein [Staphylococcus microti]
MITITKQLEGKYTNFVKPIEDYIKWLNSYRHFKKPIEIILHDHPILSYGYLCDCHVDMKDRKIYYSLYGIEQGIKKRKKSKQDAFISVVFDVFGDLALQLSKFYMIDQDNCDIHEYIRQYEEYEKRMYQEKEAMVHQHIYMTPAYQKYLKHGLKIKFKKEIPKRIVEAMQLFETFLHQQMTFPIRVTVTFTKKSLKDCDGYFVLPHHSSDYPKIKVSLQDYQRIKKKHGTYTAVLNTLEILAHELGHYHEYINGKWFEDEIQSETYADQFEQNIIQLFIDDVYAPFFRKKYGNDRV